VDSVSCRAREAHGGTVYGDAVGAVEEEGGRHRCERAMTIETCLASTAATRRRARTGCAETDSQWRTVTIVTTSEDESLPDLHATTNHHDPSNVPISLLPVPVDRCTYVSRHLPFPKPGSRRLAATRAETSERGTSWGSSTCLQRMHVMMTSLTKSRPET
jgi:hypothetical protein